jgi:hypothetical protein
MHTLGGKERRGHFPRRRSSPAAFENPEGIASAGSHQTPAGDAGSHPTLRWRCWFAPDSPLEGNGFENSVPRCLTTAISVGAFIRR